MGRHGTYRCPGGCGTVVYVKDIACTECWKLLPTTIRQAIQTARHKAALAQAERRVAIGGALGWFREYRSTQTGQQISQHPEQQTQGHQVDPGRHVRRGHQETHGSKDEQHQNDGRHSWRMPKPGEG